jgi:hypothetical protein
MLQKKLTALLAGMLLALICATQAAGDVVQDEAIKAAALDYAEGWFTGDEERMARVLHPEMLKRRVVTDLTSGAQTVQSLDAAKLIRATGEGVGKGQFDGLLSLRVAILDRHGEMAMVRVVSELYVEYLQMVNWEGRWVVLSVTWGAIEAPGG